jgi:CheY-like chemotaxis protein
MSAFTSPRLEDLTLAVVDDNPGARDTVTGELEDMGITVDALQGPFLTEGAAIQALKSSHSQIAICDHHLSHHGYAHFTGAELVARCYENQFPAILMTRYTNETLEEIRPIRHLIPALLLPNELTDDVEHLKNTLNNCMKEVFLGDFSDERRPWQTLLRVVDIDRTSKSLRITIPGWDSIDEENLIKIPFSMIPKDIHSTIQVKSRYFAEVNLGAQKKSDIYIKNISFRG